METMQNNEVFQQFLKMLEENGRQEQAAELSSLMWYMDGMDRKFDAVFQELQEVKAQLAQEKQPAVKKVMQGVADNMEHKVEQARVVFSNLREQITDYARSAVEKFKDAGVSALDKAVVAMGVKNGLEFLQLHISGMIADTKQNIEKVENIGHELRSVGGHLKNAGRAATGKETQTVDGGHEGRFQSVVLAPMRGTQRLLTSMNNATLAAIGGVEHLELQAKISPVEHQKTGKHLDKKPSIRQTLTERRAEVAARPAPAPEKECKPQEAAL